MRQPIAFLIAAAMLLSIPFFGSATSPDGSSTVAAQSVAKRTKRKSRYVVRRTWDGTKWTTRKVRVGGRKTWKGGRKVVSRTKKILS